MKCIKSIKTGIISRVHDSIAWMTMEKYPGDVIYVPKSEWKAQTKNANEKSKKEKGGKPNGKNSERKNKRSSRKHTT